MKITKRQLKKLILNEIKTFRKDTFYHITDVINDSSMHDVKDLELIALKLKTSSEYLYYFSEKSASNNNVMSNFIKDSYLQSKFRLLDGSRGELYTYDSLFNPRKCVRGGFEKIKVSFNYVCINYAGHLEFFINSKDIYIANDALIKY